MRAFRHSEGHIHGALAVSVFGMQLCRSDWCLGAQLAKEAGTRGYGWYITFELWEIDRRGRSKQGQGETGGNAWAVHSTAPRRLQFRASRYSLSGL